MNEKRYRQRIGWKVDGRPDRHTDRNTYIWASSSRTGNTFDIRLFFLEMKSWFGLGQWDMKVSKFGQVFPFLKRRFMILWGVPKTNICL